MFPKRRIVFMNKKSQRLLNTGIFCFEEYPFLSQIEKHAAANNR